MTLSQILHEPIPGNDYDAKKSLFFRVCPRSFNIVEETELKKYRKSTTTDGTPKELKEMLRDTYIYIYPLDRRLRSTLPRLAFTIAKSINWREHLGFIVCSNSIKLGAVVKSEWSWNSVWIPHKSLCPWLPQLRRWPGSSKQKLHQS